MAQPGMIEFEVDGRAFKAKRLDAVSQFMLSLKLTPILVHADPLLKMVKERASLLANDQTPPDLSLKALEPISTALSQMPDDAQRGIMRTLLSTVYVTEGPALKPIYDLQNDQISPLVDIDGLTMVKIAWRVFEENLGGFFGVRGLTSPAGSAA